MLRSHEYTRGGQKVLVFGFSEAEERWIKLLQRKGFFLLSQPPKANTSSQLVYILRCFESGNINSNF